MHLNNTDGELNAMSVSKNRYEAAAGILVAVRKPLNKGEIATKTKCSPNLTRILVDSLYERGFLSRTDGYYEITVGGEKGLVSLRRWNKLFERVLP